MRESKDAARSMVAHVLRSLRAATGFACASFHCHISDFYRFLMLQAVGSE
jgi:hypothetical protein